MMLFVTLYPQFHPRRALDERAVVAAKSKTPVTTGHRCLSISGLRAMWKEARTGRCRQGTFSTKVGQVDHPSCDQGARDAYDAQDDLLFVRSAV